MSKNKVLKIAFSGKMQSSKDTSCNYLKQKLGFLPSKIQVVRIAIADAIKGLCKAGLNRDDRESFQKFGTEIVRDGCNKYFGTEDFWVNIFLNKVRKELNSWQDGGVAIICTDVRFPNEAKLLKENGFKIIRLQVTYDQQIDRARLSGKDISNRSHITEMAFNPADGAKYFDYIIEPCDEDKLYKVLDSIVEDLLK